MKKLISVILSGSIALCGSLPCWAEGLENNIQAISNATLEMPKDSDFPISDTVVPVDFSKIEEPATKKAKTSYRINKLVDSVKARKKELLFLLKAALASLFTGGLAYGISYKLQELYSQKLNEVYQQGGQDVVKMYLGEVIKYMQKQYPNFFSSGILTQYMDGDNAGIFSILNAMKKIEDDKQKQLSSQLNECKNEKAQCEERNIMCQEDILNTLGKLGQQVQGNINAILDGSSKIVSKLDESEGKTLGAIEKTQFEVSKATQQVQENQNTVVRVMSRSFRDMEAKVDSMKEDINQEISQSAKSAIEKINDDTSDIVGKAMGYVNHNVNTRFEELQTYVDKNAKQMVQAINNNTDEKTQRVLNDVNRQTKKALDMMSKQTTEALKDMNKQAQAAMKSMNKQTERTLNSVNKQTKEALKDMNQQAEKTQKAMSKQTNKIIKGIKCNLGDYVKQMRKNGTNDALLENVKTNELVDEALQIVQEQEAIITRN